jgi:N-glycosylase/DNA lyase
MKKLLKVIENLKKTKVKNLVDVRIKEFKEIGDKTSNEIFRELCFCILTANFNAERSIKIQNELCDGFLVLNQSQLSKELEYLGHRYPRARTKYILDARRYKDSLKDIIESFDTEGGMREWLVKNVKGLGYKEASHFLRNIGYTNLAIIDFHIINVLVRYNLIKKPRTITKKKYLEIEDILKEIARKLNLNLAELDLYLWYMETGKILK